MSDPTAALNVIYLKNAAATWPEYHPPHTDSFLIDFCARSPSVLPYALAISDFS